MAIYGYMVSKKGSPCHVYLNEGFGPILDAIAESISRSRLGPSNVARSQLINKAIENYIKECKSDPSLSPAIEKAEQEPPSVPDRNDEILIPLRTSSTKPRS
jgi:hypothetical protein